MTGREAMSTTSDGGAGDYKVVLKRLTHQLLDPVVRGMLAIGLQADHLTVLGFALSLGAGVAFAIGKFRIAASIALAAGLCDILDGQLARLGGRVTRFGAFLDSTLDRVAEAALFVGIAWYYMAQLVDMTVNPSRVMANLEHNLYPITFAFIALFAILGLVGRSWCRTRGRAPRGSGSSARSAGSSGRSGWWC